MWSSKKAKKDGGSSRNVLRGRGRRKMSRRERSKRERDREKIGEKREKRGVGEREMREE